MEKEIRYCMLRMWHGAGALLYIAITGLLCRVVDEKAR